jgi:hypothetical protein
MLCLFCRAENDDAAMVCNSCARDIAVPRSLLAERDDLIGKRELLRGELTAARGELEQLRRDKKNRSA